MTREEIYSAGWVEAYEQDTGRRCYMHKDAYHRRMKHNEKNDRVHIYRTAKFNRDSKRVTEFRGVIKTKQELKKIIEQING
jgi:translation initiation factor 1 (eIF-1/SUI1)